MSNLAQEIAHLPRLTVAQLRGRFAAVFGEPTNAQHKTWLIKRIAWRLQALAQGDLSERARQRAAELANDADLRLSPPKPPRPQSAEHALPPNGQVPDAPAPAAPAPAAWVPPDGRLPLPGSVLTRLYKGQQLQVTILHQGFAFQGQVYGSLSAVAKAITGSHCNGFLFFRLRQAGGCR
jgi:hypothetical protein